MATRERVFIITADQSIAEELRSVLPRGFSLERQTPSGGNAIVFFDMDTMRPGLIRDISGENFVIAVTAQRQTGPVMEAITFGAYETIIRPLSSEQVTPLLQELADFRREISQVMPLSQPPLVPTCAIVGHSQGIMDVCKTVARLSQVEVPVLITGETGTGKELVAESIAQLSARFGKPFVVVNCAAVPEALLESELFGFEKGSFTGAVAKKEGMLRIADEGTVFFDELGELPLALQGKLLRFLQTQTFYPLGSTREVQVNVRVISATNRDLAAMVREGRFREDLYHRLKVAAIHLPPLRERREDILPLMQFFWNRYRQTAQRQIRGMTKAFYKEMLAREWRGNIRELENVIRSAIALSKTLYLTTSELKEQGASAGEEKKEGAAGGIGSTIIPFVKEALKREEKGLYEKVHREVDRLLLEYVLSFTGENQSEAARILGINRLTLRKKLGL